ncbi:MAG: hypothetical protein IK095_07835 [Oscillospiraceae bacterium]|nr:hypothetical protein [Oscillospiraceae bacterium]
MIRVDRLRLLPGEPPEALRDRAARKLRIAPERIESWELLRRSLDARDKSDLHYVCSLAVAVRGAEELVLRRSGCRDASLYVPRTYEIPRVAPEERPVVVGFGPAGMFAALLLAKAGARPLVLERGRDAESRKAAVDVFRAGGALDPECNVQFGEGGAGTFSDGKLNTGTHDPRISWVLEQFAAHGAPESIRYDAKPHIGTDILIHVVQSIRREILDLGGEVRFGTRLTELLLEDGALRGIRVSSGGREEEIACSRLILAIGHSARDSFEMLWRLGVPMEPKAFSMGLRIEHRQADIDRTQYGRPRGDLPAADYSLNVHLPDGKSAYTFCMCPGGEVIAAASEEGGVVTNGMSCSARDGENANAALLVTLHPEDFPEKDPLSGMRWQRQIERRAFEAGGGNYHAPAQRVGDFLAGRPSLGPGGVQPSYRPGVTWTELHEVLPPRITGVLERAIPALGQKLRGFDDPDAVLTAPETRSSSPVRILRGEDRQSAVRGLFPCGEGAGYAGGITSAAVDGLRCAEALLRDAAGPGVRPKDPEEKR